MITSFPKMIRCHGDRCILQENVEDKYTRKTYLIIIIIIKVFKKAFLPMVTIKSLITI